MLSDFSRPTKEPLGGQVRLPRTFGNPLERLDESDHTPSSALTFVTSSTAGSEIDKFAQLSRLRIGSFPPEDTRQSEKSAPMPIANSFEPRETPEMDTELGVSPAAMFLSRFGSSGALKRNSASPPPSGPSSLLTRQGFRSFSTPIEHEPLGPEPDQVGYTFLDYVLGDSIGRGTWALVRKASHPSRSKNVAVKIIKYQSPDDSEFEVQTTGIMRRNSVSSYGSMGSMGRRTSSLKKSTLSGRLNGRNSFGGGSLPQSARLAFLNGQAHSRAASDSPSPSPSKEPSKPVAPPHVKKEIRIWKYITSSISSYPTDEHSFMHPHILPLLDVHEDETKGYMYLVAPLCTGGSLLTLLNPPKSPSQTPKDRSRSGSILSNFGSMSPIAPAEPCIPDEPPTSPLPLYRTVRIFSQVIRGLEKLHELGVVHRDLKLENILRLEETTIDAERWIIADFGFAAKTTLDEDITEDPEDQPGSLAYTPPEVLQPPTDSPYWNQEETSAPHLPRPARDIYALGIILFALLVGRLPFDEQFEPRLRKQIIEGKWEVPRLDWEDHAGMGMVKDALVNIMKGCLNPEEDRWDMVRLKGEWEGLNSLYYRATGQDARPSPIRTVSQDPNARGRTLFRGASYNMSSRTNTPSNLSSSRSSHSEAAGAFNGNSPANSRSRLRDVFSLPMCDDEFDRGRSRARDFPDDDEGELRGRKTSRSASRSSITGERVGRTLSKDTHKRGSRSRSRIVR